nr:apoferritin 2 [Hymenolepis microstoma]
MNKGVIESRWIDPGSSETFVLICTFLVECELDKELEQRLNSYLNHTYHCFYFYERLAAHFSRSDRALFGFSDYFRRAASEELNRAHILVDMINKRDGKVNLYQDGGESGFVSKELDASQALEQVAAKVHKAATELNQLYQSAYAAKDVYVQNKLFQFVKDHVEAMNNLKALEARLCRENKHVEFLLDQELRGSPLLQKWILL